MIYQLKFVIKIESKKFSCLDDNNIKRLPFHFSRSNLSGGKMALFYCGRPIGTIKTHKAVKNSKNKLMQTVLIQNVITWNSESNHITKSLKNRDMIIPIYNTLNLKHNPKQSYSLWANAGWRYNLLHHDVVISNDDQNPTVMMIVEKIIDGINPWKQPLRYAHNVFMDENGLLVEPFKITKGLLLLKKTIHTYYVEHKIVDAYFLNGREKYSLPFLLSDSQHDWCELYK